ncbi:MAG: cytochrome C [Proteobacteria bacterium]|nr:cytochrome C [Pseudomonadota bacterium]
MMALLQPINSQADSIESLFSPGELSSAHQKQEKKCASCHDKSQKGRQDELCMNCHDHKDIKQDIRRKTGFHGRIILRGGNACKQCHREHRGREIKIVTINPGSFDHGKTDFVLKGQHTILGCKACHKANKKYRDAPSDCYSCHKEQDIHTGSLGKKCGTCHDARGWKKSGFDHDRKTDFPLRGKHSKIDCQLCHIGNKYKDTPKQCVSCHKVNDAHGGGYGTKCDTCHRPDKWKKSIFNHNVKTKYKLTGKHKTANCDSCHTGKLYKQKLKTTCISCHRNDDDHKGKNGGKCQNCHSTVAWRKTSFNHDQETDFPLTGRHEKVRCGACHRGSVEKKLATDCYSCHKFHDPHKGKMGKKCDQCHYTEGWAGKVFFEHDITRFPLIGGHAVVPCEECHITQVYKEAPLQCVECHEKNDEHEGRFGPDCGSCHNPNSWKTWLFDHNAQTDFKLDGSHEDLRCYSCHKTRIDKGVNTARNCASCHGGDDIHSGGFGRNCQQCHNTRDFGEIDMSGRR